MNLITDFLFGTPTRILLVWGGGALLIIFFFLRQPTALTLNSGEKCRLQISRRALRRLVEACGEGVKGVAMARADISHRGDTLRTKLRLKVRPRCQTGRHPRLPHRRNHRNLPRKSRPQRRDRSHRNRGRRHRPDRKVLLTRINRPPDAARAAHRPGSASYPSHRPIPQISAF